MRTFKSLILASTLIGSMAGWVNAAFADDAPKKDDVKVTAKKVEKKADDVQDIVVTGSHLRRKDLNSASPILTVTAQTAELSGATSAADLLQKLPQASSTSQTNTLLGGYVVTGGAGIETVSLFGLGAQRTLVLLNGRRMGPAGVGGTVGPVDLNVLPLDALQQVDIQLDGSSSIYGSDAIGGVINYITKKNTDGLELIVHGDVPERKNGQVYTVSIVDGVTFDKGYISALASFHEETGLEAGDRKNTRCDTEYYFDPSTGNRSDQLGVNGQPKCFNSLNNSAQVNGYGGVFQWDPTHSNYAYPADALGLSGALPNWVRAGRGGHPDTYAYENTDASVLGRDSVIEPVKTATLFVSGGYDLTSTANLYTELLYNRRQSVDNADYQLFPWVDPNNPTNVFAPVLGQYARPLILYNHDYKTDVEYVRAVAGIKGTITNLGPLDGFKYDAYYQVSNNHGTYGQNFVYNDRVNAATGPNGACDSSQMTVSPAPCVTIPWFDPNILAGHFTAAQRAFLFGYETGHTDYVNQAFEYSLTGDVYRLPAGPVSAAAGVYLSNDQMNDTPGYNAQNSNLWGFSSAGVTKGHYSLAATYGEVYVPIIKDVFLVKNLDLTVSGRLSDYDTSGTDGTFKVGGVWNLTNEYALHATHGDSYRAPTIYESHLANQTSYVSLTDPCVNYLDNNDARIAQRCSALGIPSNFAGSTQSSTVYTGGGADLQPETSVNTLFGGTWTPSFADLKVTVDYNFIKLKNTITNFGSQNIVNACYYGTQYPNFFCGLITRDSSNEIAVVHDNYVNIGRTLNRNIALKISYRYNTPWGRLAVFSNSSWQISNKNSLGESIYDYTGSTTDPVFTNSTHAEFYKGDYTFHWGVDILGKASDLRYGGDFFTSATYPNGYVTKYQTEFYAIHNISIQRRFDKFRVTVGISNLFDNQAPNVSSGEFRVGTAALNAYDLVGRSVFFNIDKRF